MSSRFTSKNLINEHLNYGSGFFYKCLFLNFTWTLCFRASLGSEQNCRLDTNFLYTFCPHTCITTPVFNISQGKIRLIQLMNLTHTTLPLDGQGSLLGWTPLGLNKLYNDVGDHGGITYSSFTLLKHLCAQPVGLFCLQNLVNNWSFHCYVVWTI